MKPDTIVNNFMVECVEVRNTCLEDDDFLNAFNAICHVIKTRLEAGGAVYAAGNGGSAADSQHFVAELIGRYVKERPAFKAVCLNSDTSVLTAIANDFGFEEVFTRQLDGLAKSGDVFLAISTSGNSKNILHALTHCEMVDVETILLTGETGGKAEEAMMADYTLKVPSTRTAIIQSIHGDVLHSIAEFLECDM